MKKQAVAFILAVIFLTFSGHCLAGSASDVIWGKRIQELEEKYGDQFTDVNNMRLYYQTSTPVMKYGPSCRMVDNSTQDKKKRWVSSVKKLKQDLSNGEEGSAKTLIQTPWYYWSYRKFIKDYNKGMKAYLPPGVQKLYRELMTACAQYDYCKKQSSKENIMFVFPAEGVMGLKVPTGDYSSKTDLTFLFLLPEEKVESLHTRF